MCIDRGRGRVRMEMKVTSDTTQLTAFDTLGSESFGERLKGHAKPKFEAHRKQCKQTMLENIRVMFSFQFNYV